MIMRWRKGDACSKSNFRSLLFPARSLTLALIVDTPTDTPATGQIANAYVEEFAPPQPAQTPWSARPFGPDNPPWGVPAAVLVWIASVLLLFIVPTLAGAGYIITRINRVPADKLKELILADPTFILISVAAIIPAHLLTFWLV